MNLRQHQEDRNINVLTLWLKEYFKAIGLADFLSQNVQNSFKIKEEGISQKH